MNLKKLTPREYWLHLAADILTWSNFSHVSFCVYLSLTFLNPNQLIFSLPGMDYHALSFFAYKNPTRYISCQNIQKTIKWRKKKNPAVWDCNQSFALHLLAGVFSVLADPTHAGWIWILWVRPWPSPAIWHERAQPGSLMDRSHQ